MNFVIRPYHPSDLCALYRICLQTGRDGQDATPFYRDPELLGHFYMAPYVVREPELCFVLTYDGQPSGYVLGTRHSAEFGAWCEQAWFPLLRQRYPLPDPDDQSADALLIRRLHTGYQANPDLVAYPAHLHIDLLPIAQGQGQGKKLIGRFLAQLRTQHVPAIHLGVSANNPNAIQFYQHIGFHILQTHPLWVAMGMVL